jgi:hypothetical protein
MRRMSCRMSLGCPVDVVYVPSKYRRALDLITPNRSHLDTCLISITDHRLPQATSGNQDLVNQSKWWCRIRDYSRLPSCRIVRVTETAVFHSFADGRQHVASVLPQKYFISIVSTELAIN